LFSLSPVCNGSDIEELSAGDKKHTKLEQEKNITELLYSAPLYFKFNLSLLDNKKLLFINMVSV
jgi:hypothetical protein